MIQDLFLHCPYSIWPHYREMTQFVENVREEKVWLSEYLLVDIVLQGRRKQILMGEGGWNVIDTQKVRKHC